MNIEDIIFLMGLGFSLAAPLGPVNMEMIKRSIQSKYGFILGLFTGIGAMTGDFIIASTVLYVGEQYLKNLIEITWVYAILLVFNIFILTYIGITALRAPPPDLQDENSSVNMMSINKESSPVSLIGDISLKGISRQYLTGFIIVVTSPWSYFWWTSFGGYIINSGLPLATGIERLIVTIFFLAGIFIWVFLLTSLLGISRRFASPTLLDYVTKGSALIIIGFAIKILYDGLVFLSLL